MKLKMVFALLLLAGCAHGGRHPAQTGDSNPWLREINRTGSVYFEIKDTMALHPPTQLTTGMPDFPSATKRCEHMPDTFCTVQYLFDWKRRNQCSPTTVSSKMLGLVHWEASASFLFTTETGHSAAIMCSKNEKNPTDDLIPITLDFLYSCGMFKKMPNRADGMPLTTPTDPTAPPNNTVPEIRQ